ncbi:hypothetical protein V1522DRAFT_416544, partial [Lipomyces starkeyi]
MAESPDYKKLWEQEKKDHLKQRRNENNRGRRPGKRPLRNSFETVRFSCQSHSRSKRTRLFLQNVSSRAQLVVSVQLISAFGRIFLTCKGKRMTAFISYSNRSIILPRSFFSSRLALQDFGRRLCRRRLASEADLQSYERFAVEEQVYDVYLPYAQYPPRVTHSPWARIFGLTIISTPLML